MILYPPTRALGEYNLGSYVKLWLQFEKQFYQSYKYYFGITKKRHVKAYNQCEFFFHNMPFDLI